jgi:hypothetical protein
MDSGYIILSRRRGVNPVVGIDTLLKVYEDSFDNLGMATESKTAGRRLRRNRVSLGGSSTGEFAVSDT